MKTKALDDIKNYAAKRLQLEYGFCGVCDSPNFALLNSSNDPHGIDITIEIKETAQKADEPGPQSDVAAAFGVPVGHLQSRTGTSVPSRDAADHAHPRVRNLLPARHDAGASAADDCPLDTLVKRGVDGNGQPWTGTVRDVLSDYETAAAVEARMGDEARAEVKRLRREVRYLRHYGNKDCTTMADDAMKRNELEA